jgi:hypothetical protein
MSRLGPMAATLLLLGAGDALVTHHLEAVHGRRVTRWAASTEWSEATGDETWHVWAAQAGDGAPRVVVHGPTSLAVWTLEGKRVAHGVIPWGTNVAVADFTGDGQEEIAVATENLPPAAPVSVQVVDQSMNEVTPNVGLLESLENPASVAIASFPGPRQVVAADFRGCLASLVGPDLAWEYCFPNSKVGGDPYAVRHLLPVAAGGGLLLAGRATGEVDGIDAAGQRAWSFRLAEPLQTLAVARLDGGAEVAFAGGDKGRFALLDAATGQVRGSGTLPGMVMVARPAAWNGQPVIAAAGLAEPSIRHQYSGYVAVLDGRGARLAVTPVDGQVIDLVAGDLDGDGTDELVAVTGAYRLLLLRLSGAILVEEPVADPSGTKLALVRGSAGPTLIVSAQTLEAKRVTHVDAPPWYAARPIGAAVGVVLLLTLALLATLRPPAPQ